MNGQHQIAAGRSSEGTDEYAHRACPLCQSTDRSLKAIRSEPPGESVGFARLMEEWQADIFSRKSFFSYFRCHDCGLLYCPTYPTEDQLARLYAAMKPNMSDLPEMSLRRTQGEYATQAMRAGPPDGDVIEIGPDQGFLAARLVKDSRFSKFWFIEPNATVHNALRAAVSPSECHISRELNGFGHIPDCVASVATMVHVLDHLTNPMLHLNELYRCLKPGGIITIVVHNERSLLARMFGPKHPIYCPYHPQLFNPDSLGRMLSTVGFTSIRLSRTRNHYPIGYLLKNAFFRVGFNASWVPIVPWAIVPLPLGNIQAVAVRR